MSKKEDFQRERKLILDNQLQQISTKNYKAMKMLEGKNPKYARHMFLKNSLIEKFAMHAAGGFDILDQPVCTSCEKPCAWDTNGSAYCFSCNRNIPSKDAITVLEYLLKYTDTFTDEQLEKLNMLGDYKR